jgi:hypothetical protein
MDGPAPVQASAREVRGGMLPGLVELRCVCCGRLGSRIDPFASG